MFVNMGMGRDGKDEQLWPSILLCTRLHSNCAILVCDVYSVLRAADTQSSHGNKQRIIALPLAESIVGERM